MAKTFMSGDWVIPMAGPDFAIAEGAVVFEEDRIIAVGTAAALASHRGDADRVLALKGHAILPGLVNTHTHVAGAITKAMTEDVSGFGGAFKVALPMHEHYVRKEDVYIPGLLHAVEMLRTGTTTINECWWHMPESAKVIHDSGLRGVVAAEVREMDTSNVGFGRFERNWDRALADRGLDEAAELFENWHGKANGRITCRVAPDGPDRCTPKLLTELKELADRHGVGLHAHTASVPGEQEFMLHTYGKRTIPFLHELGLLGPNYIGAHCAFVDEDEIALMAETGTCMSHTAYLVAKRGYYPPMEKIYKAGVSVSLGSDWLSNDMWKVMRFAALVPRVLSGDVGIRSGKDVLRMATIEGARCLGLAGSIGSLEPGKKADIIAVDMRSAWYHPFRDEDLAANLVFNNNGGDVREVFVDGAHLVSDGRMTTIDEQKLIAEARAVAKSVWDRAAPLFAAQRAPQPA